MHGPPSPAGRSTGNYSPGWHEVKPGGETLKPAESRPLQPTPLMSTSTSGTSQRSAQLAVGRDDLAPVEARRTACARIIQPGCCLRGELGESIGGRALVVMHGVCEGGEGCMRQSPAKAEREPACIAEPDSSAGSGRRGVPRTSGPGRIRTCAQPVMSRPL